MDGGLEFGRDVVIVVALALALAVISPFAFGYLFARYVWRKSRGGRA